MSSPTLKKIKDQVIVITGASSGIGLTTALMAGEQGAKVVLSSRNSSDLVKIAKQIKASGGDAIAVTADVSNPKDVIYLKEKALAAFGRIDTWVNNAGASLYGYLMESPTNEARQIFETNFWGLHYGSMAAIDAMKKTGGVLVNLGSEVSERAVSPQTMYSASKHAVKGYTEGLRTEIEEKGLPIFVSLVRPAGIDTPYTQHAANFLPDGKEPSLPAPVYHPRVVAEAILACAETGKRDVYAGGGSKFFSMLEHIAPRLLDYISAAKVSPDSQKGTEVSHTQKFEGLMEAPPHEGETRGGYKGHVMQSSVWTKASINPKTTLAVGILGALALVSMTAFRQLGDEEKDESAAA